MYFKQKVVELRKEASMTQEFFAQEVGVSRQAVYKWEKGISYPEAEKLILIAKLFNVSIDSLLEDDFDLFKLRTAEPTALEAKAKAKKKAAKKPAAPVVKEIAAEAPIEKEIAIEEVKLDIPASTVEEINIKEEEKTAKKIEKKEAPAHTHVRKPQPIRKQQKPVSIFDGLRGIFSRKK